MKKDVKAGACVCPMPVLIVAAYDESGNVQLLNAAWGITCEPDKVALHINSGHATTAAIRHSKAFTVAIADAAHVTEADYVGIASGNSVADKFAKTGLHATKSAHVNAPVIDEFPISMECELADITSGSGAAVIGKVVNVLADESVLDADGNVAIEKTGAILFDTFKHGYYTIGEKAGQAWSSGNAIK